MDQKSDTKPPEIKLNCCQGRPAPVPVVEGWRQFLRLPEKARKGFVAVVSAMRGCDFLLRQACALDVDTEAFRQDLSALSEGDEQGVEVIVSQYDGAKAELRKVIVQESLADHGKVLVGIDWRVDNVTASDRGAELNTTVVLLTLRYRENNRVERITLQLTPEAIRELKLFSDRFSR